MTTETKYNLTYFNTRGITEPIRMIFAVAKVPFEEFRFPKDENWPFLTQDKKDKLPWGIVPVLEFDGIALSQSATIARFLARRFNLVGADEIEAARCDEIVDCTRDFFNVWIPAIVEKDDKKQKELVKSLLPGKATKFWLTKIDTILSESENNWIVGSKLSWADITITHCVSHIEKVFVLDLLGQEFKSLRKMMDAVYNTPGIKEWIEQRPQTQY